MLSFRFHKLDLSLDLIKNDHMKMLKYIFTAIILLLVAYSCMSDSENREVRFSKSDLSELTIYYGSKEGVKTVEIGGDSIQDMDSLHLAIMNNYFKSQFRSDRERFEGGGVRYEFSNNRVTYINRNNTSLGQLVSTYEFRDDSLFIDLSDGSQYFAGLGTSPSDIHYHSGFAYYYFYEDSITPKKDTLKVLRDSTIFTKDELLTNKLIAEKFGFTEDFSDMAAKDTIVWCNVIYRFSK